MRLRTIWTIPAMTFRERLRRTADWCDSTIAFKLPKRIKYWAVIYVGSHVMARENGELAPDGITLLEVLESADGKPRT